MNHRLHVARLDIDMLKQNGFTLLEVLVTLVIVSFGLLGIAGVIANSIKVNQSSYARSQASWLANDIIDRMRANRIAAEVDSSPYNLTLVASPSGATIASTDLIQWRTALANTLPGGTGSVAIADDLNRRVIVVVQWNDQRASGAAAADNRQFRVETRL